LHATKVIFATFSIMATMHDLETLRVLLVLESALIQVQLPAEPCTLH
jgi:hypothetical protein